MAGLDPAIHSGASAGTFAAFADRRLDARVEPGHDEQEGVRVPQNRKYLWAMGSISAGSQVSSSPSARTS